jgi:hypothetical protein
MNQQIPVVLGFSYTATVAHTCAALGNAFSTLGLSHVLGVDHYGRSWSGFTDTAADISRRVTMQQAPVLASIMTWFSALPTERASKALTPHMSVHAFGRKRTAHHHFAENDMSPQVHTGEMHFSLMPHVHTTVVLRQQPGSAAFTASPGVLPHHVLSSQQSGLYAMLPTGTVVRNDVAFGKAHTVGTEFFYAKEEQVPHLRSLYAQNTVHGGLMTVSGKWNNVNYRLRVGAFRESAGVLTTKSAGALSLGKGSVTSTYDLTTMWQPVNNLYFLNTLTYGRTQVCPSPELRLITPTAPLQTLEWRMGVMGQGTLGAERSVNWGLFYSEPSRVVSAPVHLLFPVEHRRDGSIRYHEEDRHLRPDGKERRVEGVVSVPLASDLSVSTAVSYIKNPGHSRQAHPHMAVAFMLHSK